MTKTEFLAGLQEGLEGQVSSQIIQESVEYYNRYIDEAVAGGKTEMQVLEELGPVRLIVKTIIDANSGSRNREEQNVHGETKAQHEKSNGKAGFHADINDNGQLDLKYGRFSFNSWYGKLLLILLAVLVIALIIAIVVGFFVLAWYLLPFIVLIVIIVVLAKLFMGRR